MVLLGKNRDRVSIIAAILESANGGASKTRIMFGANLSFQLLEKYLAVAVESDFIRLENARYHLTEHGREYLKKYKHFEVRYDGAQKTLESLSCERERFARFCKGSKVNVSANSIVDSE